MDKQREYSERVSIKHEVNPDDGNLDIGTQKGSLILVCHGDDQPDQFAGWLEPLVNSFKRLLLRASEFDVDLNLQDGCDSIYDVMEFCQQLGIQFNSTMWEGSLTSGIYRVGWLEAGGESAAAAQGLVLVRSLEEHVDNAVRSTVIAELRRIEDLDEFIARTAADRPSLLETVESLRSSLATAEIALEAANQKLLKATESVSQEIDRACVRLAAALLAGEPRREVAGPLVLWDDGVVYAISSWGNIPIPEGSSPAILLYQIQKSGRQVVLVKDKTVIGGWLSGPIYRKGPSDISGWARVWSLREKQERAFSVDPPEYADSVRRIHQVLTSSS